MWCSFNTVFCWFLFQFLLLDKGEVYSDKAEEMRVKTCFSSNITWRVFIVIVPGNKHWVLWKIKHQKYIKKVTFSFSIKKNANVKPFFSTSISSHHRWCFKNTSDILLLAKPEKKGRPSYEQKWEEIISLHFSQNVIKTFVSSRGAGDVSLISSAQSSVREDLHYCTFV